MVARWLIVILYAGFIFWASSKPLPEFIAQIDCPDRIAHALEYGLFSFLLFRACLVTPGRWLERHFYFVVIALSVLYGGSDEIHQSFIPGRMMSVSDFLFDTFGSITTVVIMGYLLTRKKKITAIIGNPPY